MAWYDEAVFYHIYPLGLLGAPKLNPYSEPEHRLKELDKWIEHIKKIGCNAIYIGPLFESVGHGYETTDYKKLDGRLGDNADLKKFVQKCHKVGIKVIFDGVFNHTGRDFFAFKDLLSNRENSRYKDWFCNVNFGGNNEYNDGLSYENWGGYNLLVKLNQRNPEVKDYICDVIRFWVSEFDVDGIRLDAADVLDFDFMKEIRKTANEVKPEFWLMGEVIHGDYTRWVNGETLHSVTNYVLHKALFSGHNDHNYYEIAHTVRRLNDMFGDINGLKLYNFVDNHDVARIASKLDNRNNLFPVYILEYTLPGVPSIYYGSEFGIEGKKESGSDDSLRPAIDLKEYASSYDSNPYTMLLSTLGRMRQSTTVFAYGNYEEKLLTNRQFAFTRNTEDVTAVVAVNNDENRCDINIGGVRDGEYVGVLSGVKISVSGGNFSASMEGNSGEIYLPPLGDGVRGSFKAKNNSKEASDGEVKNIPESPDKKKEAKAPDTPKAEDTASNDDKVKAKKKSSSKKTFVSAKDKYGLDDKYDVYDTDEIAARTDYERMSVEELQVAILEKMAHNGNVDAQMIKTVMDNVYPDSLNNWVRSFR